MFEYLEKFFLNFQTNGYNVLGTNQKYCTTGEQNQTSEFRNLYIKQVKQTIMYIYDWNLQYVPQGNFINTFALINYSV